MTRNRENLLANKNENNVNCLKFLQTFKRHQTWTKERKKKTQKRYGLNLKLDKIRH